MLIEAAARVRLEADGATVETDMTDIGTGTYAIFAQIAGEMLGLPADRVTVRLGDTDRPVPRDLRSSSRRARSAPGWPRPWAATRTS